MAYNMIKYETQGKVATITMDRPKALNALCSEMMGEIADALSKSDENSEIHAIILTGGAKAFAAGADIHEMHSKSSFWEMYGGNHFGSAWEAVSKARKPVIAAVSGYALGGGCELAMMCDIIVAADNAKFGQPEITLATIPGLGGTQRLTRAVGKAKAMDMILTGRMMDASEADRCGLISRVVKADELMGTAFEIANRLASLSLPSLLIARECVDAAQETSLEQGLKYERRMFYASFETQDRGEGMAAFIEKREPNFNDM